MSKMDQIKKIPASQTTLELYCLMGEALSSLQLLEDCISHFITLKKDVKHPKLCSKEKADKLLENHRRLTLGQAIALIKKSEDELCSAEIKEKLDKIKSERNWLVHKSLYESLDSSKDGMSLEHCRERLFLRIKNITNQAQHLQYALENDLINFSEKNGIDMSNVREAINKQHQ